MSSTREKWALTAAAGLLISIMLIFLIYLGSIMSKWTSAVPFPEVDAATVHEFHIIVGLPVSALSAFVIVLVLRQVAGPMMFRGLGFSFKGSSGPVVLWIMVFLSMVWAIKLLS